MRVLAVTVEFPPRVGGIASHVAELQTAMRSAGHDYHVLAPVGFRLGRKNEAAGSGPEWVTRPTVISGQPFYGWMVRRQVRRLLRSKPFDVLHVHGLRPLPASVGNGRPVVFTNHSSGFLARLNGDATALARLANRLAPTQGIIAPSTELAEATRRIGHQGPIEVIPNGVDPHRFSPRGPNARRTWGVGDREVVFLLPRRLVEKNGVTWFARSLALLGTGAWRAVIAGAGPEEQEMRRILATGGVLDRCVFLGSVPQERMPEVYRGADVAVLPSLREATSIAGLEAMATGLPIVGTNVGGIPEIVQDGISGLLVPPGEPVAMAEALKTMIQNATLRHSCGQAGRERVEQDFSWAAIARRTTGFLERCASGASMR
jgi:glycosyltransferase involved in cell wall biosynthesis